jgi:hypothetical protein
MALWTTTPGQRDPELTLWKKILQSFQNRGGSQTKNNPDKDDTTAMTLRKLIKAVKIS